MRRSDWPKFFITCLVSLCAHRAFGNGTNYTWIAKAPSPNDHSWSDARNWSPTGVPGDGDSASIGNTINGFQVTVDATPTLANLTLINDVISTTGPLTVNGTFESQYNTLQGGGNIVVNGSMNMDLITLVWNETTVLCPMTINGSATVNSHVTMVFGNGATVVNNGTFTLANNANLANSGGKSFINNGNFLGGNSTVTADGSSLFSNTPAGFIGTTSGTNKLQFSGTLANSGAFVPAGNGTIHVAATTALHNGTQFGGSGLTELVGTTTLDGQVTVPGSMQLSLPGLTLNGLLEVPGGGSLTWLGGTIQGVGTNVTGTIQVDNGATMTINQLTYMGLLNVIVTNSGVITISDPNGAGQINLGYNARIDNSGNFDFLGDGDLQTLNSGNPGYNVATFNNFGTMEKNGGTNFTTVTIPVNCNSGSGFTGGVIRADQGTLQLGAGGILVNLAGTARVKLSGGTFSVATPGTFGVLGGTNQPSVYLTAGVLSLTYDLSVSCPFEQDAGSTITGNHSLSVSAGGNFVWAGGTIALTGAFATIQIGYYSSSGNGKMTIAGGGIVKQFKSGTLVNYGTVNWAGDNNTGGIWAADGVVFFNAGQWNCLCDAAISDVSTNTPSAFTNSTTATVTKRSSTGTTYFDLPFRNDGTLQISSGTIEILAYDDSGAILPVVQLTNGAQLKVDNKVTYHGYISGRGTLAGNHGTTIAGQLEADNVPVVGDLADDGKISLGDGPGIVSLNGNNYTQTTNGLLVVPIRGTNAVTPDFGQLTVSGYGQVTLAGTLQVQITEGYAPPIGATFPFLTSFQRNGTFNNVILPQGLQLNYNSGGATLVVTGTVPVGIISPLATNGQFQFGFNTISNRSYTVQYKDDLSGGNWTYFTNFTGNGGYWQIGSPNTNAQRYFRVSNP